MTRQFNGYGEPTEFSTWLRGQKQIGSDLGFTATNIDFLWHNYKTGEWMFLEEKRYNGGIRYAQSAAFEMIDAVATASKQKGYKGFWLLTFEKTSPDDGKIWLTRICAGSKQPKIEVTKEQLTSFLSFDLDPYTLLPTAPTASKATQARLF